MIVKCPCCGKDFNLSEDEASRIRDQIRNAEFEAEVANRIHSSERAIRSECQLEYERKLTAVQNSCNAHVAELNQKLASANMAFDTYKKQSALAVEQVKLEAERASRQAIDDLNAALRGKEQELQYYRDLKLRMSTKMIGETLEQHCETEFNKIRAAAFPKAYFGKDNVVSKESGSKGDYIFRDFDADGTEFVSIMFEMKNESDSTSTKKRNENFFKELDKDRNEKGCEYAVLVSLLESDSELYNQGIVDVSYAYPKMYVIRPQFFIPMITLLRNAALNTCGFRRELAELKNRNINLSNFEFNFNTLKEGVIYNQTQAGKRISETVAEIDKVIQKLEAVKSVIANADRQLQIANRKASEATVEKLCLGAEGILEEIK